MLIASPTSIDERGEVASSCVRSLKIPFPALLDDLRNSTESAYNGWPDRLYVIGQDGCIAYKSRPGPFGFKPAEVAAVLSKIVRAEQQ